MSLIDNPTDVVSSPRGLVVQVTPGFVLIKYQPVAGRLIGGGTASVITGGAVNAHIPEGALLVSCVDEGTATSVS